MTAILLTAIGIMNNAIVTSGVGNGFSLMIAQWSQGSLVLAIALVAIASLVLGMGLPVTAAYIILAILTAPALAGILADGLIAQQLMEGIKDPAKAGVFVLVDHPLVAQVGTGMTKAESWELIAAIPFEIAVTLRPRPMATGFESWKIAKGLYVVPLLFAYTPLVSGSAAEIMQIGFFALFGIYATNALIQWYAEGPIGPASAAALVLGAAGAYWPLALGANIAGAALVLGVIVLSARRQAGRANGSGAQAAQAAKDRAADTA